VSATSRLEQINLVGTKAAFYAGAKRLIDVQDGAMTVLDDYGAVVVRDTTDLWSRWPGE